MLHSSTNKGGKKRKGLYPISESRIITLGSCDSINSFINPSIAKWKSPDAPWLNYQNGLEI